MHYLPNLFNQRGMFLKLNGVLRHKDTNAKLKSKIDRFLYCASCVLKSLDNMSRAEGQSVTLARSYLKQLKFPESRRIALSVEPLFEVYAQIPTCVTSIVVMQNLILEITQGICEVKSSVPSSLNEAMKKGLKSYGFSIEVDKLISDYWNNGGKFIRSIRDINEHHGVLVDQTFFEYKTDPGQILIFFPDNPETKSPSKFTYENEYDAFNTLVASINVLNKLIESICDIKEVKPLVFTNELRMGHMGELIENQERTLGLMINIDKSEHSNNGVKLLLDTIELMQIIPKEKGGGNIAIRKLKTDNEVEAEQT